ncbi:MAG: hypothetical protein LBV74_14605 [Tannerella sp.]|jgi:hypothetical protein|nr:hypothetical protein [Tannerella sp.]
MNKLKIILVMTSLNIVLSSSGCDRERDESSDDRLTLEKVNYSGNKLRIDGYYYENFDSRNNPYISVFFLYENGIILYGSSFSVDQIIKQEERYRNGFHASNAAKFKYYWGVFQINGDKIKYEKWVPVEGPLFTVTYEGVILNDTTFVINKNYITKEGKKKEPGEIYWEYHFKQFSPKPDSTNRFIP